MTAQTTTDVLSSAMRPEPMMKTSVMTAKPETLPRLAQKAPWAAAAPAARMQPVTSRSVAQSSSGSR